MEHAYQQPAISEYAENIHKLEFPDGRELYLIGTAHVSKDSVQLVEDTIVKLQADTICVELDEQRLESITRENRFKDLDIIQIIKRKRLFFFIGQFVLSTFQKRMSEKTGSKPGAEFKRAVELAQAGEAKLVMADRNIGVTLKRAWRLTRFRDKFKLIAGLAGGGEADISAEEIEKMKTMDAIDRMVGEFAEELPVTKQVLIDERDAFLTGEIQRNLGKTTVAVVGAGHVPGMLKRFAGFVNDQEMQQITTVPKPSKLSKILPWLIPLAVMAGFVWGIASGNHEIAKDAALYWVLANGIFTAFGCLLALSHPLTALAGFIAAPITSLNPTIGAGFVTAFVQALLLRPRVRDLEAISNRTLKFRHWWSNRLTKVFLVFILSSLGSSIGTFVALPMLIKIFGQG